MSQHEDKFEEEFSNWAKAVLGLQKARDGSINYIRRTMEPFVDKLSKKHTSNQMEHFKDLLIKVTVHGDVKKIHLDKKDGTQIRWLLDKNKCTTCDEILEEQLDMFIESWCPCKKWICNSTKEQVEPASYWWILAKMYIAKPEIINAVGPEEVEPLAIFNLIKHCKLFDAKLRLVVDVLVQLSHKLMHSANDRLTRKEMDNSFDKIKEFLKQIAANPTETTDIINEVETLEKRTAIIYDEKGELSELAKEALQQQDKSLNADVKAPGEIREAVIKSLATSYIAIKDIQRKYEESEKKIHQYEGLHGISDELVNKKKSDVYKIKRSRDINIKISCDTDICESNGCCLTPDNHLLVTDIKNMKVKRIDTSTLAIVDYCLLNSCPAGIVCIDGIEAAVACMDPNKIQFVSIGDKMKPTRKIDTSHTCYGIAMKDEHLYVTDWDTSIYVYAVNGTLLSTIINDNDGTKLFSSIEHIAFNASGDKMFVSDSGKGLVCFDGECNHLSTINDNELYGARGVCTDGEENVFVTYYLSNKVVQYKEDGKKIDVVVKRKHGLSTPLAISFHQGRKRMYVTMKYSNQEKMYELE